MSGHTHIDALWLRHRSTQLVTLQKKQLAESYPLLFHMAEDGSWPSIRQHGLLSTDALLDLFGVRGKERDAIVSRRRPESVTITHPRLGTAVIRDNKPLSDSKLARVLRGITLEDWYRTLNRHVFFWLRQERLMGLLNARAYRDRAHTVLILETGPLLEVAASRIRLAPINSGSTAYRAAMRGVDTFLPISRYPYDERRKLRGRDAVVELAVAGGIPDIRPFLVRIERWKGSRKLETIWQR